MRIENNLDKIKLFKICACVAEIGKTGGGHFKRSQQRESQQQASLLL